MIKLIALQHRLPSINWMLSQIKDAGICDSASLVSKPYSSIPFTFNLGHDFLVEIPSLKGAFELGKHDGALLLDEGGGVHKALPDPLKHITAGVEQTTSGLGVSWKCPMVLVCRSAAKLFFESQIIANSILRKLDSLHLLKSSKVGVIGLGALGSEIARALLVRGVSTMGVDIKQPPNDLSHISVSLDELLKCSDIVLGCTGTNVLDGVKLESYACRITFISCSSNNVEFRSVLDKLPKINFFESVGGWIGNLHATVINGGYPINFDREKEWENFQEILLTRMLVIEGLVQARKLIGKSGKGVMLDPTKQLDIVQQWLEQVPNRENIRIPDNLTKEDFIKHSEGELILSQKPHGYYLHETTPHALEMMRSHTSAYSIEICGLLLNVLPNVWSPNYDWSSCWIAKNLPLLKGKDFLEIGCGTGLISLVAASQGANKVVAVDINSDAVRNTLINFKKYHVENAEVYVSDLFSEINGEFDIITWNAPFHGCRPGDMLERGCCDEEYIGLKSFFRKIDDHLKPGGKVVLGFSESGDVDLLEALISDFGYRKVRKISDWRDGYNCLFFELTKIRTANLDSII